MNNTAGLLFRPLFEPSDFHSWKDSADLDFGH